MSSISNETIHKLNTQAQAEYAQLIRITRLVAALMTAGSIFTFFSLQNSDVPPVIAIAFAGPLFLGGAIWAGISLIGRYFSILARNLATHVELPKEISRTADSSSAPESERIASNLSRVDYFAWMEAGKPDLTKWDFSLEPNFKRWLKDNQ